MFSGVRAFINRHKRKFFIGGVLIGGSILLAKYTQKRLREWREKETEELLDFTRKRYHFDSTEKVCNQTALKLAPNVKEEVNKILNTEQLLNELRSGVAVNRVAIWEQLKVSSFTKIVSLVYANSLLMVTLRIQLNLIGGYIFRSTKEDDPEISTCTNLQGKYLSMCQYFLEEGIKKLCDVIQKKVCLVISDRSLKEKLNLHDIEQIFWAIQSSISSDPCDPSKNLETYVLPNDLSDGLSNTEVAALNKLMVETHDLLESEEVAGLSASCISKGFSLVMDQLADYFLTIGSEKEMTASMSSAFVPVAGPSNDKSALNGVNLTKVSIPMAKIIPIVNGLVQSQTDALDYPHTWMEQLVLMEKLKILGANVYEAFSNKG